MISKVLAENAGFRLDVYVAQVASAGALSRQQARKLCLARQITVDAKHRPHGYLVSEGELIEVELPRTTHVNSKLNIVFENKRFITVEKPRAMHCVRQFNSTEETLEDIIALTAKVGVETAAKKDHGLIQRLDYWTSGLVLVAKTQSSEDMLRGLLEKKLIQKTYLAWVQGIPKQEEYLVEAAIDAQKKKKVIICEEGVAAKSHLRVVHRNAKNNTAMLRISGQTMHRHQVRVHAASIGHPLVGDELYGADARNFEGFFLHAQSISFVVPETKEEMNLLSTEWKNWPKVAEMLDNDAEEIDLY